jgi:hypothetical protein
MAEALPNAAQWSTRGTFCPVGAPPAGAPQNLRWDLMPVAHYSQAYLVNAN